MFWIKVISCIWDLQIFPPVCSLSSYPLIGSFAEKKCSNLMESNLSTLPSPDCTFGVKFKNCLLGPRSKMFSYFFLGRSFIVLHLIFKFIQL